MVYARDLKKECQTDCFMGKGFEKAFALAEEIGEDLEVGKYYKIDWNKIYKELKRSVI